jgi:alcohol dehydrogenase (NADP+)
MIEQEMIILNTGAKMPQIGLGTWKSEPGKVGKAVQFAIEEAGYRHIDCATIYGNEKEIGEAFNIIFSRGEVEREDVFVTSKLWNTEHHPDSVRAACEQTLKDLELEYLDLYLMHWGIAQDEDESIVHVPIQDTWRAMEKLVEEGLVKAIGVSNFTAAMLNDVFSYAKIRPSVNQIEMHPYLAQDNLRSFCQLNEVVVTAYSPLGRPGSVQNSDILSRLIDHDVVQSIAEKYKKTPAQVLLRFGIERGVVVIPKSTNPDRIRENMEASTFVLSQVDVDKLCALDIHHRYVQPRSWWIIPYFD